MSRFITWGKCDNKGVQGWAHPLIDSRFWQANYSRMNDNESSIYYPWAVMDNYGELVPVPYQSPTH